jgi:hypothetical protein
MNEFKQIVTMLGAMLITMFAGIVIGGFIGYDKGKCTVTVQQPVVLHDTIIKTDTCFVPSPPDTVTKTITKIVQVPLTDVEVAPDVDSARITLPFEQHHAQLGDVAEVWYSGYDAKIDSAIIYKRQQTIIEQHYITQPSPSNIIGLEAGAKDASMLYIHRFGKVHVGFSAGSTYDGQPTARGFIGIQF